MEALYQVFLGSGGRTRTSSIRLQRPAFCQLNYPRPDSHGTRSPAGRRGASRVNDPVAPGPLPGVKDAGVATEPGLHLDRLHAAYLRTHARLWRSVLAWSGSREVADEACAEAFAQAARRGEAVRDVDAWVWRTAFRIADGDLRAAAIDLVRALRTLTDQQRACVVLRDVAGMTAPEVAAALGTSATTVRVQALRGRRRLRELLEDDDG